MEIMLEIKEENLVRRTNVYERHFKPFVDKMAFIREHFPEANDYPEFNEYVDIVKWPIRKLEYDYVLRQVMDQLREDTFVLDAGCGVTPLPFVFGAQSKNVFAVDFSASSIQFMAKIQDMKYYSTPNPINFSVQDICNLPFDTNSFDLVTCVSVLEHIDFPHYVQALCELYRILKPGGKLVCTMDFWLGDSRKKTCLSGGFTKEDFMELFNLFGSQVDQSGVDQLDLVDKTTINRFWSSFYESPLMDISNREYVAVGYTIVKSTDDEVIGQTIRNLSEYQISNAYDVLLDRNKFIKELMVDYENRLSIIHRLNSEKVIIEADREKRLALIIEQERQLKELKDQLSICEQDRSGKHNIIDLQQKVIERLEQDHSTFSRIIEEQQAKITQFEQDHLNLLNVIKSQQKTIEDFDIGYHNQLETINVQNKKIKELEMLLEEQKLKNQALVNKLNDLMGNRLIRLVHSFGKKNGASGGQQ
jgi:SAM-dependent methyltransferase